MLSPHAVGPASELASGCSIFRVLADTRTGQATPKALKVEHGIFNKSIHIIF